MIQDPDSDPTKSGIITFTYRGTISSLEPDLESDFQFLAILNSDPIKSGIVTPLCQIYKVTFGCCDTVGEWQK